MGKPEIGTSVITLQSVDSTNKYAYHLLHGRKVIDGTVILADFQTHGKGQGKNSWHSEAGLNLLCSVILYPDFLLTERQFYLSMCASNAMIDLLRAYQCNAQIKWPNDIMVNGQKIAGLLIENIIQGRHIHAAIIGIGINVNQTAFPPELQNPTSLYLETGLQNNLPVFFQEVMHHLNTKVDKLYQQDYPVIKTNYLNNLWLINKWADFKDHSGIFIGRITDISESGELIVLHRTDFVLRSYRFKEIQFLQLH
jgi:BirA family transcriptional regulator, biotin operon repressor / biotin---[acetyl-CoA-carboxylase] ligase